MSEKSYVAPPRLERAASVFESASASAFTSSRLMNGVVDESRSCAMVFGKSTFVCEVFVFP